MSTASSEAAYLVKIPSNRATPPRVSTKATTQAKNKAAGIPKLAKKLAVPPMPKAVGPMANNLPTPWTKKIIPTPNRKNKALHDAYFLTTLSNIFHNLLFDHLQLFHSGIQIVRILRQHFRIAWS